ALRAVGAVFVVVPVWLRDKFRGLTVLTLGLMVGIFCCVTPRGGSTGGATGASASVGTTALLGAGFALAPFPLPPFPLAPLLAALARAPWCAWPSLAKLGFAASAASTMLEMTSRKHISLLTLTYAPGCGGAGVSIGAAGSAPSRRSRNNVISGGTTTSRTIGP